MMRCLVKTSPLYVFMFLIYIMVAALSLKHLIWSGDTMPNNLLWIFEPIKVSPHFGLPLFVMPLGALSPSKCLETCRNTQWPCRSDRPSRLPVGFSSRAVDRELKKKSSLLKASQLLLCSDLVRPFGETAGGQQLSGLHHPHSISFKGPTDPCDPRLRI